MPGPATTSAWHGYHAARQPVRTDTSFRFELAPRQLANEHDCIVSNTCRRCTWQRYLRDHESAAARVGRMPHSQAQGEGGAEQAVGGGGGGSGGGSGGLVSVQAVGWLRTVHKGAAACAAFAQRSPSERQAGSDNFILSSRRRPLLIRIFRASAARSRASVLHLENPCKSKQSSWAHRSEHYYAIPTRAHSRRCRPSGAAASASLD